MKKNISKLLFIFVGVLVIGQIVWNIVGLMQSTVVDYGAINLQIFLAFAIVIIGGMLYYFINMTENL